MFYFLEEFHYANSADDSTPYSENKSTGFNANDLEQSSSIFLKWLNDNRMRGNTGQNHFLVSSNFKVSVKIDNDNK